MFPLLRHAAGKQTLRSLSLSYQKKDWRAGPSNSSFGMTLTNEDTRLIVLSPRGRGSQAWFPPLRSVFLWRASYWQFTMSAVFWWPNGNRLKALRAFVSGFVICLDLYQCTFWNKTNWLEKWTTLAPVHRKCQKTTSSNWLKAQNVISPYFSRELPLELE